MNVGHYQAASALNANSRWQEIIAENLASSSSHGYRKQEVSFAAVQAGLTPTSATSSPLRNYVQPRVNVATSFQPGEMNPTGSPTDVAVDGTGFLEVQLPDGTTAYTRNGQFRLSAQGQLTTPQGYVVLSEGGPIQVDLNNPKPLSISTAGEISQGADAKGRFRLTDFDNPRLLTPIGGGLFLAQDPALVSRPAAGSSVMQGYLEGSNTSAVLEMAKLMTAMRSFEANQRIVQMQDERLGKAISELTSA